MLDILRIKPGFTPPDGFSFHSYLQSFQELVHLLIPQDLIDQKHLLTEKQFFSKLNEQLPLINWSKENRFPSVICIRFFSYSHVRFSNGIARFFIEMFDRFAIPGHYLGIEFSRTLDFFFIANPEQQYGVIEIGLKVDTATELELLQKNLPLLCEEVLLTILTVYRTRYIVALKTPSKEEKTLLVQKEIKTLISKSTNESDSNLFDYAQGLIHKILAEEKVVQLNQIIASLAEKRPRVFNRDIFVEIQDFVLMFRKQFAERHSLKYLSRVICFLHLIRKALQTMPANEPEKRHLFFKLLRMHSNEIKQQVLGVIVGINLRNRLELFERSHVIEAFTSLIPESDEVTDSCVADNRWDGIRLIYIEFKKKNSVPFSQEEFSVLKKQFAQELKQRVEAVIHPVFMFYNQEEILKDIVQLSRELKRKKDLPQAVIRFAFQTQQELSFKIVIARLISENSLSFQKLFSQCPFQVVFEKVKQAGQLTQSMAKEAAILNIYLPKSHFYRKDRSLDLYKARKVVVTEIIQALGEFRDYNGGLIACNDTTFFQFKELVLKNGNYDDFLLENFFFSIQPMSMQNLLDKQILEKGFLLFMKALENDFEVIPYFVESETVAEMSVVVIASVFPQLKEEMLDIFESMNISSTKLSFSWLTVGGIYFFTSFNPPYNHLQLYKILQEQFGSKNPTYLRE
jgi:hypothetical protein